ncbi:ABC-type transport system involved in multi-copper enzyme maturation, permease component [Mycoplasmopsis maculosa]|uniref:ABC-type transport system involved in multi-copper enzyme maturation, permease component n=1 Tax=Mycoplasmopsis maculosa TaxID=114885 RepID=A0A449B4Y2_9BACT|nr:ABC transporter permease [Mycoplasmopsis maculosa]VEU75629.1 ABC-type transport system involved in multi-copper enzyme maturation, permease component [Mycoplasmopsis maculosa]
MKQINNHLSFLLKLFIKKVYFITILSISIFSILLVNILAFTINLVEYAKYIFYGVALFEFLLVILLSSITYVWSYKDLEEEGIEILIFSKPITRKQIFVSKTIFAMIIATVLTFVFTIGNISLANALKIESYILEITLGSIFSFFFAFLIFGSFVGLIAYKVNAKIAISIPFVASIPLILGGSFIASDNTSTSNEFAKYLNLKYQNNPSGKLNNIETFYLNDQKDKYFILPNGLNNSTFSEKQKDYLENAFKDSNNSGTNYQVYAWTILPFQMLDIFNYSNSNILGFVGNNENNLSDYLYYKQLDSYLYNYELSNNSSLLKLVTTNTETKEKELKYIVPSSLKNNSIIPNLINTKLIYSHKDASNFNVPFEKDNFSFGASDDLVGEIDWNILKEALADKGFNILAKEFFENLNKELELVDNTNSLLVKKTILDNISSILEDSNSKIRLYENSSTILFNEQSLKNKTIKSEQELKIYLASALIYYLYFNNQDSFLLKSLLKNDDETLDYTPSKIQLTFGENTYFVGGYSSYETKQEVKEINGENKVIIRYQLNESDNFMFQAVNEVYELRRSYQVVNKYGYIAIWLLVALLLNAGLSVLYYRKDYK